MIEELKLKTGLNIKENVSLKEYTTFKIGGPAKYFVEINNKQDLHKALKAAIDAKLSFFILGGGSNILVSDDGFDGLIIRLIDAPLQITGNSVKVFPGVNWKKLVREAIRAGLQGLEFSANIPGTAGGAVRGNAGAYGKGAGDYVKEVEILIVENNEVGLKVLPKEQCGFEYRNSVFKQNENWVISEISFELEKATKSQEELLAEINEENEKRCAKQPLKYPSAGCSFMNITYTENLSRYKDWEVNGKLPAARFVEAAGMKGKEIGGAKVSNEHTNFIINTGNATASDVIQLISMIKMKVRDDYGIQLMEEFQYVGF